MDWWWGLTAARLLLDTHVLLWNAYAPSNLSPRARDAIVDADAVYVSSISAYEIALKFRLGKLDFARILVEDFEAQLSLRGLDPLAVTTAHGRAAGMFDLIHRDPFDRIIAAQAQAEGLTLVSSDPDFDRFGVTRLW